jgi:hypothetical protein
MNIWDLFQSKANQLSWGTLDNVMDGSPPAPIEKDDAYFAIRIKEMYIEISRKLWRKYYPMLYSFVEHGTRQENAISGPGQLKEIGDDSFDRLINLNYRIAGPTPYTGEDVTMLVGLYSVPGEDSAKALIETVSVFAGLAGVATTPALEITNAIKGGVDRILSLNDARLQLGVRDTFNAGKPLKTGVHIGLSKPAAEVDFARLWLKNGRLYTGDNPVTAKPYQGGDYIVVEIERRDDRPDWPALPGISEFQDRFNAIMQNSGLSVAEKKKRLGEEWPAFTQTLDSHKLLTRPDKRDIAHSVMQDLLNRLDALAGKNPFVETRGWGAKETEKRPAAEVDFLDIPQYTDRTDPQSVRIAEQALRGQPFA